jgi:hypothetical protein
MTVNEKIEKHADGAVHLFKEGVFWVGYEQSAYILNHIRALRTTKRFVKKIEKEVVTVGFPAPALDAFLERLTVRERTDTYICAAPPAPLDPAEFERWKSELPAYAPLPPARYPVAQPAPETVFAAPEVVAPSEGGMTPEAVYERVRRFRLSSATPMECMIFLETLQSNM